MKKRFKIYILLFCAIPYYYNLYSQQSFNDLEYKDQVGYLNPENEDWSPNFKRCSDKLPIGTYSSTSPYIFRENKGKFRKFIIKKFNGNQFTDTGLLNLRFVINCQGDIGDIEVNELNFEFERINLNDDLVDKLKKLAFQKENWNYDLTEKPFDYYMYLIFRIENGKVVEILP